LTIDATLAAVATSSLDAHVSCARLRGRPAASTSSNVSSNGLPAIMPGAGSKTVL
jgi:hypothetical protein